MMLESKYPGDMYSEIINIINQLNMGSNHYLGV